MKYFGKNSPQLKKAGIVAAVLVAALFGLAAVLVVAVIALLFQVFSNTSISLDVNQLVQQFNTWVGSLFGAGQDALENAPVQIQVN
jgi:hypothetical protein